MIEEKKRELNEQEKEILVNWKTRIERTTKARMFFFVATVILLSLIILVSVFMLRDEEYNKILLFLVLTVVLFLGLTFWSNRQQHLANKKLLAQIKFALDKSEARVVTVSCDKAYLTKHDYNFGYLFIDKENKGFFIEHDSITQNEELPNSDFDVIQVFDEEDNLLDIFIETRGISLESLEVEEEVIQKVLAQWGSHHGNGHHGSGGSDKGYIVEL